MAAPLQSTISPHPEFPEVLIIEDPAGAHLFYLSQGLELHGPGRVVRQYTADHRFRVDFFQCIGRYDGGVPFVLRVTEVS